MNTKPIKIKVKMDGQSIFERRIEPDELESVFDDLSLKFGRKRRIL